MSRWHLFIVAAWLRRVSSEYCIDQWGRQIHQESPDYHPAKASKIYNRFKTIIDKHV